MRSWAASRPPIFSKLQECCSIFSHIAGELATVCFVTLLLRKTVGQLVKDPPMESFSAPHCSEEDAFVHMK